MFRDTFDLGVTLVRFQDQHASVLHRAMEHVAAGMDYLHHMQPESTWAQ